MIVYVIEGSTGEYDDRHDWVVCVYFSKKKAEEHQRNADKEADRIFTLREAKKKLPYSQRSTDAEENKYDPGMCMDYTGTTYYVSPVDLLDFQDYKGMTLDDLALAQDLLKI